MSNRDSKVIGYFSYSSPTEIVCTGDACVISGSEKIMSSYINEIDPTGQKKRTIKKTRFGEILRGLKLGAAYAFDEESYGRFYPLALEEGLAVEKADFEKMRSNNLRFFTVQLKSL